MIYGSDNKFGVALLIAGGCIFFYRGSGKTSLTKKQKITLAFIFFFDAFLVGFESYLFKDYFTNLHISEMNFLVSVYGVMFLFLSALMLPQIFKQKSFPAWSVYGRYIRGSFFSKVINYCGALFFFKALTLTSTSQVTAMEVFYPITLLVLAMGVQKVLKIDLEEYLDRKSIIPKVFGVVVICIGAFLAR